MNQDGWVVATGSARGARHAVRLEPSEDASGNVQTSKATAIAVADGHSSRQCPRAKTGAEFAVTAALEVLSAIPVSRDQAPKQIVDCWRRRVDNDVAARAMQEGDVEVESPYLLYGTTLLCASIATDRLLLFQLGDGDILLGGQKPPVPKINSQADLTTETDSLALHDASERAFFAEYELNDLGLEIVVLMTDGFGSAFAEPNWEQETLNDLTSNLAIMHPDDLSDAVTNWCQGPASIGGDDTTMALLVRESLFANKRIAS